MPWPKGKTPVKGWQGHAKDFKNEYCTLLIELMGNGKGIETFTSHIMICRGTFYKWLHEYPDFKRAYLIAKELSKETLLGMLDEYAIEQKGTQNEAGSPTLNMTIWKEMMKYRHLLPESREATMGLDLNHMEDTKSQMETVLKSLNAGLITLEDAHKLAQVLDISQGIRETSEMNARIEQLEKLLEAGAKSDEFKEE